MKGRILHMKFILNYGSGYGVSLYLFDRLVKTTFRFFVVKPGNLNEYLLMEFCLFVTIVFKICVRLIMLCISPYIKITLIYIWMHLYCYIFLVCVCSAL